MAWVAWGFPLQRRKDKYRAGMYNWGSCNPSNSASACCRLSLVGAAGVCWDGGGFSFSTLHVPTHLSVKVRNMCNLRLSVGLNRLQGVMGSNEGVRCLVAPHPSPPAPLGALKR